MSSVPQDLVDKLNELVSNEDVPVLKRVQQVFECLRRNGFGHKTVVKPRETLTHPSNRGGSLLNATDVWDKGLGMAVVDPFHICSVFIIYFDVLMNCCFVC